MQSNLIRRESTGKAPVSSHILHSLQWEKSGFNVCGAKSRHMVEAARYFFHNFQKRFQDSCIRKQ